MIRIIFLTIRPTPAPSISLIRVIYIPPIQHLIKDVRKFFIQPLDYTISSTQHHNFRITNFNEAVKISAHMQ